MSEKLTSLRAVNGNKASGNIANGQKKITRMKSDTIHPVDKRGSFKNRASTGAHIPMTSAPTAVKINPAIKKSTKRRKTGETKETRETGETAIPQPHE